MRRRAHTAHARGRSERAPVARVARASLFAAALFASLAAQSRPSSAATFEDYRARVRKVAQTLDGLWDALGGEGVPSEQQLKLAEAGAFDEARRDLPPRERVEWADGATEVDNSWLHAELDAYAKLSPDKREEKRRLVFRAVERLVSLTRQLDEAAAAKQQARDREAEKGRLQSILRKPEYHEEASRGGALARLWDWIARQLEKLIPKRKPMQPGTVGALSLVARIFIYALALAVIVFVLWRYGPNVWSRLSTRRKKAREREARVILGETLAPDESAASLFAEAERLARAGNLRAAIRKAYVAVLCELGDRKIVRLARHKTNRDYLNGVRDRAELYQALRPLTQTFERHWYGFAPASPADWDEYRALCEQTIKY